ncbi:MAG: cupin domain-containing protein [Magnetococcales bacterium]|nr:cupin domain-containing protein [Magnetococcales bacterium]
MLAPVWAGHADTAYQKVQPLLSTTHTVLNEPLQHGDGSPLQINSAIITIQPGEETAWHKHGMPMYAYILSGSVTVNYGEQGERTFAAGSAMVEAMDHWHRGTNRGLEPVRILVVYFGNPSSKQVILQERTP